MAGYFQKLKCLQKSAWDSVISVVVELEANEWDFPTDCPGWTVKDCVSHLVGIEHRLLGREVVHPPAVDFSVAKTPQGRNNQVDVDSRKDKKICKKQYNGGLQRCLTNLIDNGIPIPTISTIPPGHKIATEAIGQNSAIRKYGQIIGFATRDIKSGEHVHEQNLAFAEFERDYRFSSDIKSTFRIVKAWGGTRQ